MKLHITNDLIEDARRWKDAVSDSWAKMEFNISELLPTNEVESQAKISLGQDAQRCATAYLAIQSMVQYHHPNYAFSLSEIEATA